jgi:hypothetical protein
VGEDGRERLTQIRRALMETPRAELALLKQSEALLGKVQELLVELRGDPIHGKYEAPAGPTIRGRVASIVEDQWFVTSPPTQVQLDDYRYAADGFGKTLEALRVALEKDLKALEGQLEAVESPWTPGRVPVWTKEGE